MSKNGNGNGKGKELVESGKWELGSIEVNERIKSIVDDFKDGVDYAVVVGKKPTLLIPGADKVNFRFNLMATFRKDLEVIEMTGIKGAIAFICELVNRATGQKVGEGRGAAVLGDGQNCKTLNGAIKMAEIRAERDAVLRTFALRERYTQDMENEAKETKQEGTKLSVNEAGEIEI